MGDCPWRHRSPRRTGAPLPYPVAAARRSRSGAARNLGADGDRRRSPRLPRRRLHPAPRPHRRLRRRARDRIADVVACGVVRYLAEGWDERADRTEPGHARRRSAPAPGSAGARRADDRRRRHELFWSLNFAVTAATWRRLGGFDVGYRGYGAEDTDLGLPRPTSGHPPAWVAGATAYHQWHPPSRLDPARARRDRRQRPPLPPPLGELADGRLARRPGGGGHRPVRPGTTCSSWSTMTTSPPASSVVVGPSEHGVVRHAIDDRRRDDGRTSSATPHLATVAAAPVRPTTPPLPLALHRSPLRRHDGDAAVRS